MFLYLISIRLYLATKQAVAKINECLSLTLSTSSSQVVGMYDALVLGAGIVGINSAYWLAKTGRKVAVFDRQELPGLETSFANGGQISVSHAEPWANPSAPLQVIKWLLKADAPLQFTPRFDWHQWRWLIKWLWQCLPKHSRQNMAEIIQLSAYSQRLYQEITSQHQLKYHASNNGILHFYSNPDTWHKVQTTARLMKDFGCNREVISRDQVLALEPALNPIADQICGGTYTQEDGAGDAYIYCQEMMEVCRKLGVDFHFNSNVTGFKRLHEDIHVRIKNDYTEEEIYAPNIIVSMGSWSAPALEHIGIPTDIYPAKGYSISIPILNDKAAPNISLTDDEHKLVFTRLGDRLRVAGTAELAGYSLEINPERIWPLIDCAQRYFPELGDFKEMSPWTGLRPATPSNLPYVGKAPQYANLWLNTGHGTLGWTMGCGSGKLLADMINNPQAQTQSLHHKGFKHVMNQPY